MKARRCADCQFAADVLADLEEKPPRCTHLRPVDLTPYQRAQLAVMVGLGSAPLDSWDYQSTCVAVLRRRGLVEGRGALLRVTDAGRAEVAR